MHYHVCLICPFLFFFETGFSVAVEPFLELALVDQAGLELTEIRLPLPPECWDERRVLLPPTNC